MQLFLFARSRLETRPFKCNIIIPMKTNTRTIITIFTINDRLYKTNVYRSGFLDFDKSEKRNHDAVGV